MNLDAHISVALCFPVLALRRRYVCTKFFPFLPKSHIAQTLTQSYCIIEALHFLGRRPTNKPLIEPRKINSTFRREVSFRLPHYLFRKRRLLFSFTPRSRTLGSAPSPHLLAKQLLFDE